MIIINTKKSFYQKELLDIIQREFFVTSSGNSLRCKKAKGVDIENVIIEIEKRDEVYYFVIRHDFVRAILYAGDLISGINRNALKSVTGYYLDEIISRSAAVIKFKGEVFD